MRLDRFDAVLFGLDGVLAGTASLHEAADLLHRLRGAGIAIAVVSASRHCAEVIGSAGLGDLVDVRVDGVTAAAMGLPGKPDPACYLEAAARLGAEPGRAVVVEDAVVGVQAGCRGGFGLVIGVDHGRRPGELEAAGADLVVSGVGELRLTGDGPANDGWHLTYHGEDPAAQGVRETLCTLANGYLGTRGARCEAADDGVHYPGTYLAGLYNRLTSHAGGAQVEAESLVNAPNWLPVSFCAAGGPWSGQPGVAVADDRISLDLARGLLTRRWRAVDTAGRCTAVTERRLVSMADPHLAAAELTFVAENWSGEFRVRAGLDAGVANAQTTEGRLLAHRHLSHVRAGEDAPGVCWLAAMTTQSRVVIAEAARTRMTAGAERSRSLVRSQRGIAHEIVTNLAEGGRATLEKVVAIHTSRDWAISEPLEAARAAAASAGDFAALAAEHRAAWARTWQRSRLDVAVARGPGGAGDITGPVARIVNLHRFHLLQVASRHVTDLDAGIPARGLAGEGYQGHVFWDELFAYPVLNFRFPEVARTLLAYRRRRLPAARRAAAAAGYRGAMFPWQSGSDGTDQTPQMLYNPRTGRWIPDRSFRQRHVGLAIAYNLWQHWQTTADTAFFADAGAEVFLEIARFFASLATFDPADGRWHIRGVVGPDEFHDGYPEAAEPTGIDDNSYTNVMTAWLLRRACEFTELLASGHHADIPGRLGIDESELRHWAELATGLYVPFHDGVISQFDGYQRLAELDLAAYRDRYGDIGRLDLILDAEGDTANRYQVTKQADVLMLLYLLSAEELRETLGSLGYPLTPKTIRATVGYYTARAVHGSTLSAIVHAWVTARADRQASWQQFHRALAADVAGTSPDGTAGGGTAQGIHLGAMAGTIDLLQRCYTGLEVRGDVLWLNPVLPAELARLSFELAYRGHRVTIDVDHQRLAVTAAPGQAHPAAIAAAGRRFRLRSGQRIEVPLV